MELASAHPIEYSPKPEQIMGDFYEKFFSDSGTKGVKRISLEQLRELKEKGITIENFLDWLCQSKGLLLHGSIHEIAGEKLTSEQGKIFVSNRSAVAIMRSLYSNVGVNLQYPYFVTKDSPLILKVHTPTNKKFIKKENGFVYLVNSAGFKNEPEGSWQFVKEADGVEFDMVIETETADFKYPVEFFDDLDTTENGE
ncbi:MAG: hypothetical protein V1664_04920 [Candidatus Uhrbacteria bacterium]